MPFFISQKPLGTVEQLVKQWKPEPAKTEKIYEKSLHKYLKKELPFEKITAQYGSARIRCDIAVGKEVFIEMKIDLKTPGKRQRLRGQIDDYRREWEKPVLVVLLGDCDEDLLHDLYQSVKESGGVKIVEKFD